MKIFKSKWFIISVSLLLLYTLLGFFLVPYFITDILPQKLSENTNIIGSIKKARFNPFTFKLDLLDSEFATKDKKPLFALHELNVTMEPSRVFLKNIKFKSINLTKPSLHVAIDKQGKLNLLNLINETNATKKEDENSSGWNVVIEDIGIKNGEVAFSDERKAYKTKLSNLNYNANGLSTKEGDISTQKLTLTSTSAKDLSWSGKLGLNPFFSKGKLKVGTLLVNDIWSYSVGDKGIYPKNANVDFSFSYDVKMDKNSLDLDVEDINIFANAIEIYNNTQKISSIKNLDIKNALLSLKNSKNLSLKNLNLNINDIKLLSSNLVPLNASLDKFTLSDFGVTSNLKDKNIITFKSSKLSKFDFLFDGNNSKVDGKLSSINLKDFSFEKSYMKLKELGLEDINLGKNELANTPFFTSLKNLNLQDLDVDLDKNITKTSVEKVLLKNLLVENKNLKKPFLNVENISLNKSILENGFSTNSIDISGLGVALKLDKKHNLDILEGLKTSEKTEEADDSKPFYYNIKSININKSSVDFADNSLKTPFEQKLSLHEVKLENITSDQSKPIGFAITTKAKKFVAKTDGKITIKPLDILFNYSVSDDDISRINPYVSEFAKLLIEKGVLKTEGKFSFKNKKINVTSDTSLKEFFLDTKDKKLLSSFKSLDLKGVEFKPERLKLKSILLKEPKGYINVSKSGKTNITYLSSKPTKKKKKSKKTKKTKSKFKVDIDRLDVKNGSFYLTNHNLPKTSKLSITNIEADAKFLYQSVQKSTKINAKALIDKSGYLSAKMDLIPDDIKTNSNIFINLKGLNLVPFSVYMEKYLGYKLKEGAINTTYAQKIKKGKLKGDIQTDLDSFYLGKSVKSKDALSLPLDLALSILRDSDGNVKLNIPIAGDMNSPDFSYGSVVITAITNIFTGVVTAPFSLLGNILGIDGEKLKTVDFKPSSNKLVPSEVEKMKQYAKILKKRPKLKLTITGAYDENSDFFKEGENNESKKADTKKLITLANERVDVIKENLGSLGVKADSIIVKKPTATKAYHGQWIRCEVGIKK